MNFTMAALLGLSLGQAPAPTPDYFPSNKRTNEIPIGYKIDRAKIRKCLLYVARNGENTWYQEAEVTPDKNSFVYTAKEDGRYWFKVVTVDLQGVKDPPDVTKNGPDIKLLIDTVPPAVQITNATRTEDDILIQWKVDDTHPDDTQTQVAFRPVSGGEWKLVRLHSDSANGVRFPANGVRFPCGTPEPIVVRVTVQDLVGNKSEATRELSRTTTTSLSPPNVQPAGLAAVRPGLEPPSDLAPPVVPVPPANLVPPLPPAMPPVGPAIQPPVTPPAPSPAPASQVPSVAPVASVATQPYSSGSTFIPSPGPTPTPGPTVIASGQGTPTPTGSAYSPTTNQPEPRSTTTETPNSVVIAASNSSPAPTPPDTRRAQVINYLRFDLGYNVEQLGPSGVKHVDLWVTRNDGQTWTNWSQHDGKELPIRVQLDGKPNDKPEGRYGFRLVPTSGAGLSEPAPTAGTTPDMSVVVDLSPPLVRIIEPISDPKQREFLILRWEATDTNFAEDPITLEWSDRATGPWQSVVPSDGVLRANAIDLPAPRRIANDGKYLWRVPMGLPPKVYLKVTARDAGGNVTEVVTPNPITVDLSRPRARINGIIATPVQGRQ